MFCAILSAYLNYWVSVDSVKCNSRLREDSSFSSFHRLISIAVFNGSCLGFSICLNKYVKILYIFFLGIASMKCSMFLNRYMKHFKYEDKLITREFWKTGSPIWDCKSRQLLRLLFFFKVGRWHWLIWFLHSCNQGLNLSVIMQKCESQIGGSMKVKHAKLSGKLAYQGVRNFRFLVSLACFGFLLSPFWDSPICIITDELLLLV